MRVLVANRGEIAVRLLKSCKSLGFHSTAIYSEEDGTSMHVRQADQAVLLSGNGVQAYMNSLEIVDICKAQRINVVIPGYGFLSENSEFAQLLQDSGILFAGPQPQTITEFGLKHRARELAIRAGVPVVPGTPIITTKEEAARECKRLGYPVMVKATAGGGGMGLFVCREPESLDAAIDTVKSRGAALFKDSGFFLEKYVENARHIEGQIFGNGQGDVAWIGERECSVQRRHQKVLEESPSPFVVKDPRIREKIRTASVALARSVKYRSAGTIEFVVNDDDGEVYFLEMNTRLQVEHGVTELCHGVDLVNMMLLQAQAELNGEGGLRAEELTEISSRPPKGHAIEVRLYAENPADDYKPSPGLFTGVSLPQGDGIRVDTWLERGSVVTPFFDPLLAKVMAHAATRDEALASLKSALASTLLCGPPTNVEFLHALLRAPEVSSGQTLTNTLDRFVFEPCVIDIRDGGLYTTVQDYPGRPNQRSGVPVSGPMDNISFRIANMLVGNPTSTEGLEITFGGPTILFRQDAVIALCGAEFDFTISGEKATMWTRHMVKKGSEVKVGSNTSVGCRAYLAVLGGLPSIGAYLGSKSTTPTLKWGGYQGRTLRAGDVLQMDEASSRLASTMESYTLPESLRPKMETLKTVYALPGPYDTDEFITLAGRESFFNTVWKVSPSSSRGGIRLEGPAPEWSRESGGEGGSHPSNVLGYGYPLGGLSFTGDSAVVFTADSPVQSGFICLQTVLGCELWKMGQLRPGDEVRFSQCSWEQAMDLEKRLDQQLERIVAAVVSGRLSDGELPVSLEIEQPTPGNSILYERPASNDSPRFVLRQAGDSGLLCDFGSQVFDLNARVRAQQLLQQIPDLASQGFEKVTRPHTMSVFIAFDPSKISQSSAAAILINLESKPSVTTTFPSKTYYLPMLFDAEENHRATERYMQTQRPYAIYLPDNVDFIRRNNGLATKDDVLNLVNDTPFVVLASSGLMGLPILMQVDPRKRFTVPKANPSRTFTPAGALGTGGNTSSIYPSPQPGGYMLWGLTLPGCPFDIFGNKPNYSPDRPWLFEPFDQVVYKSVSRQKFDAINRQFQMGMYKIEVEESVFDMAEYNRLVESTREEVAQIRERQERAARIELDKENELLTRWREEQAEAAKAGPREVKSKDALDPRYVRVVASMNAKIWKINFSVGSVVRSDEVLLVLEAMKMEIAVKAPGDSGSYRVAAVLNQPGELVEPGDVLFALDPEVAGTD
ncbi:urea carboxylase [Apodospora peruviana]|uniref:Urea carboxylase n=1 Tax=Apodospora peruviana TaxID=516989 RepID=A0AAE0HWF4_9PEZI|nr:urea carboxylase [Apodospora peruviana]